MDELIDAFYQYAMENDLFDPSDRCYIQCNDDLLSLFESHFSGSSPSTSHKKQKKKKPEVEQQSQESLRTTKRTSSSYLSTT